VFLTIIYIASVEQLYAYAFQPQTPFTVTNGWHLYDPIREYQRMGVGIKSDAWRFTNINKDYKVKKKEERNDNIYIYKNKFILYLSLFHLHNISIYTHVMIVFTYIP
jgi:predicted P-loop ATPase/GTPase